MAFCWRAACAWPSGGAVKVAWAGPTFVCAEASVEASDIHSNLAALEQPQLPAGADQRRRGSRLLMSIPKATESPSCAITPSINAPSPVGTTVMTPKLGSTMTSFSVARIPGATSKSLLSSMSIVGGESSTVLIPEAIRDRVS